MFPQEIEYQYPFPSQVAETSTAATDRVVVAVKAEKVISKTALAWALTHVIHPGDCITLLAVFPEPKTGKKKFWSFPRLTGDCSSSHRQADRVCEISESCSQMVLQFHNQIEVRVRIKVVSGTSGGSAVVAEAKRNEANWVVVDKKLKQEMKHCIEELRCNIVLMKGSQAKVLRLNLGPSNEPQTPYFSATSSPDMDLSKTGTRRIKHSTPVSSPGQESSGGGSHLTTASSLSSYASITPPFLVYQENPLFDSGGNKRNKPADNQSCSFENPVVQSRDSRTLLAKFLQYDQDGHEEEYNKRSSIVRRSSAVSLVRTSSVPPPLCSLCQHKAPIFGRPPRELSYEELYDATGGFSNDNFLAKGGFGDVYRGVLSDGQVVAVKVLRFRGVQADADFCREVKVLSCAQHRNVVLLVGFCVDEKKRMLVYEYICNGSLDFHLHADRKANLDWHSRLKIAIGTARGLRYLHEDCRVGCIVHRDMRPDNILLTHDFEPLVADLGLARRHSEWEIDTDEGRVIGTSGYLAPEYVNGGNVTDKVDVYAFGVMLLELMTGRRVRELQFENGQQVLFSNWFVSHANLPNQLLDPRLSTPESTAYPLNAMARAASLCLRLDPDFRPPMSKVLGILEGGDMGVPLSLDLNSIGNRSGHLRGLGTRRCHHSRKLSH